MSNITISFNPDEELPLQVWSYLVKYRASFKCSKCGSKEKLVSHHIVPSARKGRTTLNNGICLCKHCHPKSRLHSKRYYSLQRKQQLTKYISMIDPDISLEKLSLHELKEIFYSLPEEKAIKTLMNISSE